MVKRLLGKKPVSPIIPIALALKAKGYDPIWLYSGKGKQAAGWPHWPNEPADIAKWNGRSVALRMAGHDDLFAIDMDVQIQEVLDAILARYQERWPDFMKRCVIRHSGMVKVMLIGRLTTEKRHMYSGRYGAEVVKGGNRVELFTSNDPRYIAVWGMHSKDRDYGYDGPQLHEVEIVDLPEFFDDDLNELLAIATEVMEAAGLKMTDAPGATLDEVAYDLVPDQLCNPTDGRGTMTLAELEDAARGQFIYLNGTIFDPDTTTENRVKAKWTKSKGLTLWDWGTGITHYWKHLGSQPEVLNPLLKALAEATIAAGGGAGGIGGTTMFRGAQPRGGGEQLTDFYAYMPEHKYIYIPTGALWPLQSVDLQLRPIPVMRGGQPVRDAKGNQVFMKPHTWLDRERPVQQITWVPGETVEINDKLLAEGGWIERPGARAFNEYKPPNIVRGMAKRVDRWIELVTLIYPDDVEHIAGFFSHRVQKPAEKINHGLLLVGAPGVGKDTFIEPLKHAVGPWNFKEISPSDVMEKYNDYMQAVVIRVSEARDLGEMDRFKLYERMKTMLAAPPSTTRISAKYIPQHYIPNVAGVIITTNHKYDGLYLPPDDRRHYVAGTELTAAQITEKKGSKYWGEMWSWYRDGGLEDMADYFGGYDLGNFDAKSPPKQTPAFHQMVGTGVAPEVSEMDTILDRMGRPEVVTMAFIELETGHAEKDLKDWLRDRKNRRAIPHRMDLCGYVPVRCVGPKDGMWVINERRQTVYGRADIAPDQRVKAAGIMANANAKSFKELMEALRNANR